MAPRHFKFSKQGAMAVAARAIYTLEEPVQGPTHVLDAVGVNVGDLISRVPATSEPGLEYESCDSSDSKDDGEYDWQALLGVDAVEELDVSVSSGGRNWSDCGSVTVDPPRCLRPHKPRFRWPETLALGRRSNVKYFYLFFPMDRVALIIQRTNIVLD
ncbi:hypothetical protein GQ600_7128 [Phytophthora cactorum]|nr:hypothetical protein GQ600_7128 [Phytophthora cactorum]